MKLKITIISVFILIYGVFFYTTTQIKNKRIDLILNEEIKDLKTHYDLTMDYFIQDVSSFKINMQDNNKILNIFSQAQNANKKQKDILRKKLYKLLNPMYKRIHSRGILQWQFVFPNNISFLRMHKPSKYGDDLTDIRYSFKTVNTTKQTIIGFEQGRTTHAFRYVFPFDDKDGNHLGAIEISLASYSLQRKLQKINKIHSHFLVNKQIFKVRAWNEKDLIQKYIQSIEHKDYMFALQKDYNKNYLDIIKKDLIVPLQKEIDKGIASKKRFNVYIPFKEIAKVITFLPIKDTQKKRNVAYIVAYTDNINIKIVHKEYKRINIIVFLGLFLLSLFLYKILNHKKELEEEVKKQVEEIRRKNNLLIQQSKMASMGEMIGNIAHQWRQPLNAVGLAIQKIKIYHEEDMLTDENLTKTVNKSKKLIDNMSSTIDDFRNFFKINKIKIEFNIKNSVDETLALISANIGYYNISVDIKIDKNIKYFGYKNELEQVFLNIINNAKDALIQNSVDNAKITIKVLSKDDVLSINIYDNAGGIPQDIIDKVFDPYFTTKEQGKGTGIGLYMSKMIIEGSMNGELSVKNYDNGSCFTIKLF